MASPYEMVLGAELGALHPRLRAYFGAIPDGSVGRGHGVFDAVGTPRRWLWPVLALLGLEGVAFPVWATDVPFDVENRPIRLADGTIGVAAVRTFHLPGRTRRMVDAITAEARGLVDHLGPHGLVSADLEAGVRDGALTMRSVGVGVGGGRARLEFLRPLAPRVVLTERFDDDREQQHVSIALTMPIIGKIYEYSGYFEYAVVPETS